MACPIPLFLPAVVKKSSDKFFPNQSRECFEDRKRIRENWRSQTHVENEIYTEEENETINSLKERLEEEKIEKEKQSVRSNREKKTRKK